MSTEESRMEPASTNEPAPASMVLVDAMPVRSPNELNLAAELRLFGKHLETAFNTARTSPRAQEIQQQLTSAWHDVEKGVNTTITQVKTADVKSTVTSTAQTATDEVHGRLARGLHGLNQWMEQKLSETEERRKAKEPATSTESKSDDEIQDRFGGNDPVFGEGLNVPIEPLSTAEEPNPANSAETIVTERFDEGADAKKKAD